VHHRQEPKARIRLSKRYAGRYVTGIGFSRPVLLDAGIEESDAFIAVTSGDNSNIVGARTARDEFHVPKVVARIYDPRRADIYRDLGITTVGKRAMGHQRDPPSVVPPQPSS